MGRPYPARVPGVLLTVGTGVGGAILADGRPVSCADAAGDCHMVPALLASRSNTAHGQPGRVVDITARIERRSVVGGLISEYLRAAESAKGCWSVAMSEFWHITGCLRSQPPRLAAN